MSTALGGGLTNPMTAAGDLIDGGSGGIPERLAIGASGQVLTVSGGAPAWENSSSGFANPMTTLGDLIDANTGGTARRLAIGTAGQVLTVAAGTPAWQDAAAGLPPGVIALAPSGDTSGATDVAAVQDAIAGLPGGLGVVLCGPGNWYGQPGNPIQLAQGQGVRSFAGSAATFWNAAGDGTGPMFEFANSGTFTGGQYAAPFGGFSMLGSGGSDGAVAIAASGLQGQRVSDLYVYDFAGGGVDLTNAADTYAEQGSWTNIILVNNGSSSGWNVLYSNSSFDYTIFEWLIVALANTDGVRLQDGAQLRGDRFALTGNFYGGADGNTGAVIAIDRGAIDGTSYIQAADCYVAVESAGTGTGHITLLQGSASPDSQFTGNGTFSFDPVGPAFQDYSTQGAPFSFAGTINEPAIGSTEAGITGIFVYGQTITNDITVQPNGNFSDDATVFLNSKVGQVWVISNNHSTDALNLYDSTNEVLAVAVAADTGMLTAYGGMTAGAAVLPSVAALTFCTSTAVDAALGNAFNLTLTASTGTLANPTNPVEGQVIRFRITQGTGGSFTLAYGSAYDFGASGAPTLSTAAGKVDILGFEYVASLSKWCYLASALGN
jgi:hypothetical protein